MKIRDIKMTFIVQDEKLKVFCGQKIYSQGEEVGKLIGAEFLDRGYGTKIDAEIYNEAVFNRHADLVLEIWKKPKSK